MNINNIEQLSTNELVKNFKEATRQGKPPQELVDEMKKRSGLAFLNPTGDAEAMIAVVRAAIEKLEKGDR